MNLARKEYCEADPKMKSTLNRTLTYSSDDERLPHILDMIGRVAALDFSMTLPASDNNDMIDAISIGLNMLSEELNANVVERSKLDDMNSKLERFAYTTAHDLKSPMNSITGLVHLIELSIDDKAKKEVQEHLDRLRDTVDRMRSLVQGILEYSKTDSRNVRKEEIDLNHAFNEIIETDQFFHKVDFKITEPLPIILFNRAAISQVIRNLIDNAVKYCDKEICELRVASRELDEHFQISISDNGPGIAAEDHLEIFKLFNKMNSEKRLDSHGIGLHMIKRVLETAGGKIWVESASGTGATFHFTVKKLLPIR